MFEKNQKQENIKQDNFEDSVVKKNFEDNVKKLVERFRSKKDELKELMKDKQEMADNPSHTEDYKHVLYEIRTFKEALRRIEEGEDKEK